MTWLFLAITAYFFFALNAIGDKLLLSGTALKNSGTYAFFVGMLGLLLFLPVPILGFPVPRGIYSLFLALLSGALFVFALLPFYEGLGKFRASSMIPATGALQPIFTLGLTFVFFAGVRTVSVFEFIAFLLLILGGVLISSAGANKISKESLGFAAAAALLFALSFVLIKQAYLIESFWSGLFWSRLGGGMAAVSIFSVFPRVRREVISMGAEKTKKKSFLFRKTSIIFLTAQGLGVMAGFLQQGAVYLADATSVPLINALQGVQYVFLFVFALLASKIFPDVFRESNSWSAVAQKIFSVCIIMMGIVMLAYFGK
jgi:hypothetical protein